MMNFDKVVCENCGENVYRRNISLENLQAYDTSSKNAYIESIVKLERVPVEVATSWAEHGLYEQCETKIRNCPQCNSQLKTWKAKMCLSCGATFEPLMGNT